MESTKKTIDRVVSLGGGALLHFYVDSVLRAIDFSFYRPDPDDAGGAFRVTLGGVDSIVRTADAFAEIVAGLDPEEVAAARKRAEAETTSE